MGLRVNGLGIDYGYWSLSFPNVFHLVISFVFISFGCGSCPWATPCHYPKMKRKLDSTHGLHPRCQKDAFFVFCVAWFNPLLGVFWIRDDVETDQQISTWLVVRHHYYIQGWLTHLIYLPCHQYCHRQKLLHIPCRQYRRKENQYGHRRELHHQLCRRYRHHRQFLRLLRRR